MFMKVFHYEQVVQHTHIHTDYMHVLSLRGTQEQILDCRGVKLNTTKNHKDQGDLLPSFS